MVVAVFIDPHLAPDRVEIKPWGIAAMWELFSEDEGVEFSPWIVEATELTPSEEYLSHAGTETHLGAGGSRELPNRPPSGCYDD